MQILLSHFTWGCVGPLVSLVVLLWMLGRGQGGGRVTASRRHAPGNLLSHFAGLDSPSGKSALAGSTGVRELE